MVYSAQLYQKMLSLSLLVLALGSATATFSDFEEQVKDSELMYVSFSLQFNIGIVFRTLTITKFTNTIGFPEMKYWNMN